jgi:Protein of unknown function (DUF3016)
VTLFDEKNLRNTYSLGYFAPPRPMKLTFYAICALVMLFGGFGCSTEGGRGTATGAVAIQYVNPERFTDFSVQGRDVRSSATVFTQEATNTLQPVMESRFPGYLLTLRFTNIDLAGRRSTRGASSGRIVRGSTPARLSFDYVLQDKSGRTVASGSQRLVDNARSTQAGNPSRSGLLFNENRMLRTWLQSLSVTPG